MAGRGLMIHRRGQDRNVREQQGWSALISSEQCPWMGIMEITEGSEEIERPDRWRLLSSCLALVLSQV